MFKEIKDNSEIMVTTRVIIMLVLLLLLGSALIYRIFSLQIVNGESYLNSFKVKIKKERAIVSTRGNIYDRNGVELAKNILAYSVTIEDVYESGKSKNAQLNQTIYHLINIIEQNDDKVISDFNIFVDSDGNYDFSVTDKKLLRFRLDIYGRAKEENLLYEEQTATAEEMMMTLATRYGIGENTDPNDAKTFQPGLGYTKEELLKMVTIRYAMSLNSYQKYIPTVVSSDVNERTVAMIMENSDILTGVSIAEDTIRTYNESVYMAHIIGYTGKISLEEYEELRLVDDSYLTTDRVGKAGIEQVLEHELQGVKGSEEIYHDNLGKIIETANRVEPIAGNNIYLTIDVELQKAIYHILEQKIAGILAAKIQNIKEYVPAANASASQIRIPIDDVYFALINNNIIDIAHFAKADATETEKAIYESFLLKRDIIFETLREELTDAATPYQELKTEYQVYESYIVNVLLEEKGIFVNVDTKDPTYIQWREEESISLQEYLQYAISQKWIDITKLNLNSKYSDSDEVYEQLKQFIFDHLEVTEFSKKIYKYMIKDNSLTGKQVCLLLWEQDIINIDSTEIDKLRSGAITSYTFMLNRIENLDITPAQLALDPCSGSCVVTDVNTGEVLALVTYPSYDNNRMANSADAAYLNQLNKDMAKPLWDYATQQLSAPGSTFKMISAVAGLEEGIIGIRQNVSCLGVFEKVTTPFRCWIYPGSHGALNVEGAIEHSCNYFFYELGYQLSMGADGYDNELGLGKLYQYADMFGLSETSGVEIIESTPQVSTEHAVQSAIGQGKHSYTTVGLARYVTTIANSGTCYNLSLLERMEDASGNLLVDYTPEVRNYVELSPNVWNVLHSGMRKVVLSKSYYNDLAVNVAGKTGTAQESKVRPNHALFVGYAPYEEPEIAIATRIAFGYTSDYAAEVSREVIKYYYNLADVDEIVTGTAERPDAAGTVSD